MIGSELTSHLSVHDIADLVSRAVLEAIEYPENIIKTSFTVKGRKS